jgi:hypothetical protein
MIFFQFFSANHPQKAEVCFYIAHSSCLGIIRFHALPSSAALAHLIILQLWAKGLLQLIDSSHKADAHSLQGLCVGVGSEYRARDSGVIEVDWSDMTVES